MQGITGKVSGKMGSAVFRVREGQQIVTQYNPIVKNPNTEGQQTQRAKFKLMSQLAAVMAPGFGTMVAQNPKRKGRPSQRNAFVKLNFPLVEVSSDDAEITAKIPMEQLQLTTSFHPLPNVTLGFEDTTAILANMTGINAEVSSIRFVTIGYNNNVAGIVDISDVPTVDGAIEDHYILIPGVGKYTVLAYGLIPTESAKTSIDLDNIHTPADEDFISAIELNAMVAEGSIIETKTVGANVTVTA